MRFDLNPSPELRKAIDRWRARQDGVPAAAPAARSLIEWALAHYYADEHTTLPPQPTLDTDDTPIAADTHRTDDTPDTDDTASPLPPKSTEESTPEPQPITSWINESRPTRATVRNKRKAATT